MAGTGPATTLGGDWHAGWAMEDGTSPATTLVGDWHAGWAMEAGTGPATTFWFVSSAM